MHLFDTSRYGQRMNVCLIHTGNSGFYSCSLFFSFLSFFFFSASFFFFQYVRRNIPTSTINHILLSLSPYSMKVSNHLQWWWCQSTKHKRRERKTELVQVASNRWTVVQSDFFFLIINERRSWSIRRLRQIGSSFLTTSSLE